jgi:hypothetical protein
VIVPPVPAVAVAVLPLLHVPPDVPSLRVVDAPEHTVVVPVIPRGEAKTVSTLKALQLPPREYVILVVPASIPVNTPDEDPIVAMVVPLLAHVPPPIPSLSEVKIPVHKLGAPEMLVGEGVTVIVVTT